MDIRIGLRDLVGRLLQNKGDHETFEDDHQLLSTGRLESIDVIEMVMYLEQTHDLDFAEVLFDPDDFDSIDGMAELVVSASS